MTVRQRILRTPTHKPQMSVGQIHDAKSDNLEVFYNGPKSGATAYEILAWAPQFARPAAGTVASEVPIDSI